ncbi:hypothetical protein [Enterococcus diestrammenae]|uniref:hypothetical protein n=1 Tax=Enterococcus diestrammenae TaxID=1155073 RepID=UPI0022DF8A12|nr:hypothetical protein [Enterococcus diestrammenae]
MKCAMCGRTPDQIPEYINLAKESDYQSADAAVRYEEETYHPAYDKFICTDCYVKAGQPLMADVYELYVRQKGSVN